MPSGWDVYYVVFLSAVVALGIPAALALISMLVSPGGRARPAAPKRENELPGASLPVHETESARESYLGRRINTRFFLSANAALILITLALILIPYVGTLRKDADKPALVRGLISIVTIAGFSALGLLYSARKGDLDWLQSFRPGQGAQGSDE